MVFPTMALKPLELVSMLYKQSKLEAAFIKEMPNIIDKNSHCIP